MIFQTFEEKNECFLVYSNSQFCEAVADDCDKSWSYANYLSEKNVEYAQLYAQGASLEEVCPAAYLERLKQLQNKINAIIVSSKHAKLNLNEICIYEILPHFVLEEIAELKTIICEHVFNKYPRPENYDHLLKTTKVITDIKYRDLTLDLNTIPRVSVQDKNTYRLLKNSKRYIDYNQFKTITGRLSTRRFSFPVMTLAKQYRGALRPKNKWLYELDFNAAELRVVLGLLGQEQPVEDIHQWNIKNVFRDLVSREDAKKRVFAWLYNNNSMDCLLNQKYDREAIKNKYWDGHRVKTVFDREIESDEFHATNYIIQSTAADLMFEQMYKVWELLRGKKSFIKFCNHDSIVIDFSEEDGFLVNDIKEVFCETRFGRFKINCSAGENWGKMKHMNVN